MEAEKKQLEARNQELEQQLANQSLGGAEKQLKTSELAANRKLLADWDKELVKLRQQKPNQLTDTEKGNSKLNWAIGLGIASLAVGLLCFILLLKKRNKN